MSHRYALGQSLHVLGLVGSSALGNGLSVQAARLVSTSGFRLLPDVVVPSMGESIKQGSIAAVLKQVGGGGCIEPVGKGKGGTVGDLRS